MPRISGFLVAGFVVVASLAGCQSATLIELNNNYINLTHQMNEVGGLEAEGLGPADAETTRTSIRNDFANNGDAAMESADAAKSMTDSVQPSGEKAKARRNEVSFLSVAVRSYLSSGAVADFKMGEPAARGLEVCENLKGIEGLPTMCGYFYIARHVGVQNENIRKVRPVINRAKALMGENKLSAEDGKLLARAFDNVIKQFDALSDLGDSGPSAPIKWADVVSGLRTHLERQRTIFLCNARIIRGRIIDSKPGNGWDPARQKAETGQVYADRRAKLQSRPGGFDDVADCRSNPQL